MKILYVLLVFIVDYIFLSQVFTYDKNIANMALITLVTFMIITSLVWISYRLSRRKVIWTFVLHNVIFTASTFSLLLHSFTDSRGVDAIILSSIMFLFQSVIFLVYYKKYLPSEYSNNT